MPCFDTASQMPPHVHVNTFTSICWPTYTIAKKLECEKYTNKMTPIGQSGFYHNLTHLRSTEVKQNRWRRERAGFRGKTHPHRGAWFQEFLPGPLPLLSGPHRKLLWWNFCLLLFLPEEQVKNQNCQDAPDLPIDTSDCKPSTLLGPSSRLCVGVREALKPLWTLQRQLLPSPRHLRGSPHFQEGPPFLLRF